jgi:hypothetical protein
MLGLIIVGGIFGLVALAEGIRTWRAPGTPSGDPYHHYIDEASPEFVAGYYMGGAAANQFGGG